MIWDFLRNVNDLKPEPETRFENSDHGKQAEIRKTREELTEQTLKLGADPYK